MRLTPQTKRHLKVFAAAVLAVAIIASALDLCMIDRGYAAEETMRLQISAYKPQLPDSANTEPAAAESAAPTGNQSVAAIQETYPDVAGWLTVPHTAIDYPFVQGKDNDQYLRKDLDGKYALAGTIFMDIRCSKDFTNFNTILFGHHMKSGAMFRDIMKFADEAFWEAAEPGYIFLADKTYQLDFFAYMVVRDDDPEVYENITINSILRSHFMAYVEKNAIRFRDPQLGEDGRIVTLSTCTYEYDGARAVLLARLTELAPETGAAEGATYINPEAGISPSALGTPLAAPTPLSGAAPADSAAISPAALHIPEAAPESPEGAAHSPADAGATEGLPQPIVGYAMSGGAAPQAEQAFQRTLSRGQGAAHRNSEGAPALPFEHVPPVDCLVTSPFGERLHPVKGEENFHNGIDMAAPCGEEIRAFASGTVLYADWSEEGGWRCKISHGNGYTTRYLHCSQLLVSAGDKVSAGDIIALAGAEGLTTGAHLHFELQLNGGCIDPAPYI